MPTNIPFQLTAAKLVRVLADICLIQISLIVAITSRAYLFFAFPDPENPPVAGEMFWRDLGDYLTTTLPLTALCITAFSLCGFYTYGKYYLGRYKALVIAQAISISFLIYGFIAYYLAGDPGISRGALGVAWLLAIGLIVGSRLWNQIWRSLVHPERDAALRSLNSSNEKILVIGGAGYIGSALLPKLLQSGRSVRLLDLMMFGEEPIKSVLDHPNLELVEGDFRNVETVVRAMHGVDAVVHLGAIVGDPACSVDEELTVEVNLTSTKVLAQLAKAAGISRFVFASTCSVYGACDEILNEKSRVAPISLYGRTKLASEHVLAELADDTFTPTILRFSTIYGFSGRTRFDLVVNLLAAKAKLDGVITVFGGDQWRPFVHVDDAAKAVAAVIEAPLDLVGNEIFNVGSNEQNYTIREVGEMVHDSVIDAELIVNDDDVDQRNYRVDFRKIHDRLSFQPDWTVPKGIQQVLEAIASGDVVDYQDAKHSNLKSLTSGGPSQLARDDWAQAMLNRIPVQPGAQD